MLLSFLVQKAKQIVGWGDVAGKPETFPPDAHFHGGDVLTPTAIDCSQGGSFWAGDLIVNSDGLEFAAQTGSPSLQVVGGEIYFGGNEIYHAGNPPDWGNVIGKPATFPPDLDSLTRVSLFGGEIEFRRGGDGNGIFLEGLKHAITWNDARGNFNIRVGNRSDYFFSGNDQKIWTENEPYAIHVQFSQTSGWVQINFAERTTEVVGDPIAAWTHSFQIGRKGTEWGIWLDGAKIAG